MKLNTWWILCIMQPNLSASWLFQRAMSAKKQSNVPEDFINELLYTNFSCMQVVYFSHDSDYNFVLSYLLLLLFYLSLLQRLGDPVLRPFLQVDFLSRSETLDMFFALSLWDVLPKIFFKWDENQTNIKFQTWNNDCPEELSIIYYRMLYSLVHFPRHWA